MIYYFSIGLCQFVGFIIYQYRQPDGITLLDILLSFGMATIWPGTMVAMLVIGIAKCFMLLENQPWMNKKIGGKNE
jgi:hypothetical protein